MSASARMQARRRWRNSPTARSITRVTQSGPLTVDASFQFVDVRDLGTIDSFLKHTPQMSSTRLRSGELGGQRAGGIKFGVSWSSRATVSLARCDGALSCQKRKTRFQMLHECQEAASVSKRRRDNTPHWFWLLIEDVNVTGTETGHCYGDHHGLAKIWPDF